MFRAFSAFSTFVIAGLVPAIQYRISKGSAPPYWMPRHLVCATALLLERLRPGMTHRKQAARNLSPGVARESRRSFPPKGDGAPRSANPMGSVLITEHGGRLTARHISATALYPLTGSPAERRAGIILRRDRT
jgi:hypothetical protein